MNPITAKSVIVTLNGQRIEIPLGQPLPAGVSDRLLSELREMGVLAEATPAPVSAPPSNPAPDITPPATRPAAAPAKR